MGSDGIATNGCRIFIRVDDLEKALRFYRDLLGHPVERVSDRWADLAPARGLTLTLEDEGPVEFHVDNFEEAAERMETAGVPVERRDRQGARSEIHRGTSSAFMTIGSSPREGPNPEWSKTYSATGGRRPRRTR